MTLSFDLRYQAGARSLASCLETTATRIAIVGPSGIGKTTLLRAILGLVPSAGAIALRGVRLDGLPVEARRIGWAPQDAALFPHFRVETNLAFASVEKPIDRIAERVGVTALLTRSIDTLSGGERQRVALGRAIACAPRLYLLDEPLSALDRSARAELAEVLEAERASKDAVLVVASHDESDVRALADEVYEMQADGTITKRSSWPE